MLEYFDTLAGPICLNPSTEQESFVWFLVLWSILLIFFSVILGFTALIASIRHTLNSNRKLWAKRYGISILAFLLFTAIGWLTATGGSADDYCHTAESSIQGKILMISAQLAGLVTLVSVIGFIFSFNKTDKKAKKK